MRYLSLFSGIEAATEAWHPLGWECVGVAEIEPFPCRLLAERYPGVPNLGDITKVTDTDIFLLGNIDLVVFGSPCQDLSIAGKRKGLDGARSGLFFAAMRVIAWARKFGGCRWALWENVPGAFSSNDGRDFATVVDLLAGLEIGTTLIPDKKKWGTEGAAVGPDGMVEWSTLDAQFFGVAQRRRRVFALADFGDWASRPPILLECESLRGDTAPRRGTREEVAGALAASAGRRGGVSEPDKGHLIPTQVQPVVSTLDASFGRLQGCSGQDLNHGHSHLVAFGGNNTKSSLDVATAVRAKGGSGHGDFESETFIVQAFQSSQSGVRVDDVHATLDSNNGSRRHNGVLTLAFAENSRGEVRLENGDDSIIGTLASGGGKPGQSYPSVMAFHGAQDPDISGDITHPMAAQTNGMSTSALIGSCVRRLTPLECERLQAFRDGHTALRGAKDGPRYKALGNSMCVNVMRWIGQQIDFVQYDW